MSSAPKARIILGLLTFGPSEEHGARVIGIDQFKSALDLFIARGYDEVDTARFYDGGRQEAYTREAGWKEKGLTLSTKVRYPYLPKDNTAQNVLKSVEKSLRELGTDRVEILYLHRADRTVPFAETLEAINCLYEAGKFARFGISNFAAFEVAEIVMTCKYNGWVRPTVYQGMYNIITRSIEPELLVACRRYGIEVVVYNPLAGGLFSGKIKSRDLIPETGRFSDVTTYQGASYRSRYFRKSTFEALHIVEEAASAHGLTMIETAFRWLVHHSALNIKDGKDGILIGVSSVDQLASNLDHLEKGPLPDDMVRSLDDAWHAAKPDVAPYWHGELEYGYDTQKVLFGS